MAGLTEEGLVIKRLPEVLDDILQSERTEIDANISADDNEFLGQLNTLIAAQLASLWEYIEAVHDSFNPDRAEGNSLDTLGAIVGVSRQQALPTDGYQRFTAANGTTIPSGFLVKNPVTDDRFFTVSNTTISTAQCLTARYEVVTVLNSTNYVLSVNDTDYSYTSDSSATELEILNGLQALIAADTDATWTATVDSDNLLLVITTDDEDDLISVSSVTYIAPESVDFDIYVQCVENGPIIAPANSVNEAISFVGGVQSTTNTVAFSTGRDIETDEDYRLRIKASQAVVGKSTVLAIQSALLNTTGVTAATVYENYTETTDGEGRPSKSFEAVVEGGDDEDVAQTIWVQKPAGIRTYGTEMVVIEDTSGLEHNIYFTRPTIINLAVRVTYDIYDEEVFPANGEEAILTVVLDYVNALQANKDVIPSRMFGPIYSTVDGIDNLTVEIQEIAAPGDTPVELNWQTDRLAMGLIEYARTTEDDIYIVGPP